MEISILCWDVLLFSFAFTFSVGFFPISPAPWIHTCSKHDSDENRIQSTGAKFISLYRQESSSFSTCCTEHRGEVPDAQPRAAGNGSVPPSTASLGSLDTAELPSFHQPCEIRAFKASELLKKQPEVQQAADLPHSTPSP